MRNRRHIFLLLPLFFAAFPSFAQQYIKGVVVEKEGGAPIPGVFVVGLSGSVQTVYAFTDAQGCFELKVPSGTEVQTIRASMMGYETKAIPVSSKTTEYRISLDEKITQIASSRKTGQVAEKRGDTLSYYAGAFADGSEKALADLLEKIPELTVTESGGILHNGRYISKFYIEGLDLMGNRYGVVTKNLKAEDVAKVEIYQNHQPVRALEGLQNTDRSAVNIVLKSGAVNSWLLSADAMLGLPEFPLFDARAMLSRFSKESQSLFMLKGNNVGGEISREIKEQEYFGKTGVFRVLPSEIESDFASSLNPSKIFLSLPREYWFDNLSGIASLNHIGKLGKESQFRVFAHVAGEKDNEEQQRREDIQLQDGTAIVISEKTSAADRKLYFNTGASIEKNTRKAFFSDKLSVSGQARTYENSLDSYDSFNQQYHLPSIKIYNTLSATFRQGDKRAIGFSSDTKYVRNKHSAVYASGTADYEQYLLSRDFLSDNHASLKVKLHRNQLSISPGIAIGYTGRSASLDGPVQADADLDVFSARPYINLGGMFNIGAVYFDYELPASLYILGIRGSDNVVYPAFAPSVRAKYKYRDLEFRAGGSYDDSRSGPASLLAAPVMTNYRSLSTQDSLNRKQALYTYASVNYTNLPLRLFASLSGSYSVSTSARSISARLTEKLSILEYLPQPASFTARSLRISAEKFFGARLLVIKGALGYTGSVREEYLQGMPVRIDDDGLQADLNIRLRPAEWLSLQSNWAFRRNKTFSVTSVNSSSVSSDNTVYITPVKKMSVGCTAFWLKEELPGVSVSNPLLAKAEISYSLAKAKLYIECRNLLNAGEYRREFVSAYTSHSSTTALRPRSVMAGIRMSF